MKSSKKQQSSPRESTPNTAPDLTPALQIQELRSFIEREKAKPQSANRFKDSRPTSARSEKALPSATSQPAVPKPGKPADTRECEVTNFLKDLGLERYSPAFIQGGFADIRSAVELTEAQLTALGVALGHRIKILKRLRELRDTVPPLPSPAQVSVVLEEIKVSAKDTKSEVHKTESRPPPKPSKPAVRIVGSHVSTGLESSLAVNERECCWQCFRTFFRDVGDTLDNKLFCSHVCLERYRKAASVVCTCGAEQLKSLCVMSEGQYYCSASCIPSGDRETSAGSQPEESTGEMSVTSKILKKYSHMGASTIKEVNFEGTQPRLPVLESIDSVKGWEVDASVDLDRAED